MHWLWRQGVVRSYVNTQLENRGGARALRVVRFSHAPVGARGVGAFTVRTRLALARAHRRARARRASRGYLPRTRRRQRPRTCTRAHLAGRLDARRRHVHDGPEDHRQHRRPAAHAHRPRSRVVAQRVRRHPRGQPGVPPDPHRSCRSRSTTTPPTRTACASVPLELNTPQHPPFRQRRVPDRGAAPRRQRHHRCGLRHPCRRRRPLGGGPEAARRRVGVAAGGRPGARARRHARPRRRQRARADGTTRPSSRGDRRRHRRAPHARARAPRRSTRGCRSRRGRQPELAAGVDALQRAVATPPGARGFVRAARPSVARRGRARRHPRQRARPGQRHAPDLLQRALRPERPRCPATSTPLPSTRSATAAQHPARRRRQRARAVRRSFHGDPSRPARAHPGSRIRRGDGRRHRSRARGLPRRATQRRPSRAAHLLGALAVIQGEQPSLARGVAFANPSDWDPSDEFVTALLAGLRANPFVRPVTRRHTARGDAGRDRRRRSRRRPGRPQPRTGHRAEGAGDGGRPTTRPFSTATPSPPSSATTTRASRTPTARCSRCSRPTWRTRPAAASHAPSCTRSASPAATSSRSSTRPNSRRSRSPSSEAKIPLTFRNDTDKKVPIHIALTSDKLVFPDGTDRDVHPRTREEPDGARRGRDPELGQLSSR